MKSTNHDRPQSNHCHRSTSPNPARPTPRGRGRLSRSRGWLVGAVLLTLVGCSVDDSSVPTEPLRADLHQSPALVSYFEEYIGSSGGEVIGDAAQLEVPANAVWTSVRFSLEITETSSIVDVECGPDGQQFAVPVTLRIDRPADADSTDTVIVEWLDPSSSTWEDIGGTVVGDQMEVELNHFSAYRSKFVD